MFLEGVELSKAFTCWISGFWDPEVEKLREAEFEIHRTPCWILYHRMCSSFRLINKSLDLK